MPPDWGPKLLCGWPGLPGLWYRGSFFSLLVAIGFSILLNVALVTSFVWPWMLGETFLAIAWPLILLVWSISAVTTYRRLPDLMSVSPSEKVADQRPPDTLFNQAQSEYLRGHWQESASLLQRLILRQPRDMEARLLLATLFRHTRQFENAKIQLDELMKFDESVEWVFEIERERELLDLIEQHEATEAIQESDDEDGHLAERKAG